MSIKSRRWFVILTGDEVNSIISQNFPDAPFFPSLSMVDDKGKKAVHNVREVSLETLKAIRAFLISGHFNIDVHVAVQVGANDARYARREEYDDTYRRKKNRQRTVKRAVKTRKPKIFVRLAAKKKSIQ